MAKATHKSTRKSAEAEDDGLATEGSPTSWRLARTSYSKTVAKQVDAMIAKGGVTLADVAALQMAEIFRFLDSEDSEVTEVDRYIASGLRHLRAICKQSGAKGNDPNARKVRVPDGLRVPRPATKQHDLVKR